MTPVGRRFVPSYLMFTGAATAAGLAIVALGYFPTLRVAGQEAFGSMAAGCGVSWVASCLGAVPLAMAVAQGASQRPQAIMAAMGIRFMTVLVLVVPLVFSGWFERNVFVFWVGISYLLMLPLDTVFAVRMMKRSDGGDS